MIINISCYRDPISIDLSQFEHKIVIEAYITDQPGENRVKISRTVGLADWDRFPPVSDAVVTIRDDRNNEVQLPENDPGIYSTNSLTGVPGRTYTLTVVSKGQKYSASSRMPHPLELYKLNFNYNSSAQNAGYISCSVLDRQGTEDYFLLKVFKNGSYEDYYLYQDGMTDGEEIIMDEFSVNYSSHDYIAIELLTLNEAMYDFYYTLETINDNDDEDVVTSLVPVTTVNPTTNLDHGALGYFSAHTLRRYTNTID